MKKGLVSVFVWLTIMCFGLKAQKQNDGVQSDFKTIEFINYDKMAMKERKIVPYPSLREADIVYGKRLERVLDVREKKNLALKWPKNPFHMILWDNMTVGEGKGYGKVKAYKNDSFTSAYTIAELKARGGHTTTITITPDPTNEDYTIDKDTIEALDWIKITRYKIIELWIFDKQRSTLFPRILAICPLYKQVANGIELPEQELCYINYEDLRKAMVNQEIYNRQNDAMRLSYLDFFELRLFSSFITKESNEFNNAIKDFKEFSDSPMDALYEAERIKDELFNWEHDLWEY
ncbi:MAG: gliding motility protein GldN [Bacteroidetes bacterium]|nr:gliding motility protein GldN [Bacteroidota bacterium]